MSFLNFGKPWYNLELQKKTQKLQDEVSSQEVIKYLSTDVILEEKEKTIHACPNALLDKVYQEADEKVQELIDNIKQQKIFNNVIKLPFSQVNTSKLNSLSSKFLFKIIEDSYNPEWCDHIISNKLTSDEKVQLLEQNNNEKNINFIIKSLDKIALESVNLQTVDKVIRNKIKKKILVLDKAEKELPKNKNRFKINQILQILDGFITLQSNWYDISEIYIKKVKDFNKLKSFATDDQLHKFSILYDNLQPSFDKYYQDQVKKKQELEVKQKANEICQVLINQFKLEYDVIQQNPQKLLDEYRCRWEKTIFEKIPSTTLVENFENLEKSFIYHQQQLIKQQENLKQNKLFLVDFTNSFTNFKNLDVVKDIKTYKNELHKLEKSFKLKEKYLLKDYPAETEQVQKNLNDENQKIKSCYESLKKDERTNINRAKELVENIEKLLESDINIKKSKVEELKDKWKENFVKLPHTKRQEYKRMFDKAIAKLNKIFYSSVEEHQWQEFVNLETKEKLVQEISALSKVGDLKLVVKKVKEIQRKWKGIGPVPYKKSQDIWDNFHRINQEQYERCREFIKEDKQQYQESIALRENLCEKMEQLSKEPPTRQTVQSIKKLQQEWKQLDSKSTSSEKSKLWRKFRASCDYFFSKRDLVAQNNIEPKKELLKKLQAYEPIGDWRRDSNFVKGIQKEWQEIGVLSYEHRQLENDYKTFCDEFYQQKYKEDEVADNKNNELLEHRKAWLDKVKVLVNKYDSNLFRRWLAHNLPAVWKKLDKIADYSLKTIDEDYKGLLGKLKDSSSEKLPLNFFVGLDFVSPNFLNIKKLVLADSSEIEFFVEKLDVSSLVDDLKKISKQKINYIKEDKDNLEFVASQLQFSFNSSCQYFTYEEADEEFVLLLISYYYLGLERSKDSIKYVDKYFQNRQQLIIQNGL